MSFAYTVISLLILCETYIDLVKYLVELDIELIFFKKKILFSYQNLFMV